MATFTSLTLGCQAARTQSARTSGGQRPGPHSGAAPFLEAPQTQEAIPGKHKKQQGLGINREELLGNCILPCAEGTAVHEKRHTFRLYLYIVDWTAAPSEILGLTRLRRVQAKSKTVEYKSDLLTRKPETLQPTSASLDE